MGEEAVHCENLLPSMKNLSEDSNSCSWLMYCGDRNLPYGQYQNGTAMDSYLGYDRDFLKQTMLQHEAVFKNQVYELHRLYRTQKSLMDQVRGKKVLEHNNLSEHTPETANELPGFRLGNSVCGEGSFSQACNVVMQNAISSKDDEVSEIRPEMVRRKMIDSQLPPDEQTKAGLTDLNEPVQCQELGHGWMVLKPGYGKGTPRDKLCLPFQSGQVLSNNAFQPLSYPSTDCKKLSGERAYFEWEPYQRNPEVSYDSYVESIVASNAPSLHHGYRPEYIRPWSHWISSWDNRSNCSVQKSLPLQTNQFLNFNKQARADSCSEMKSHDFYGLYQGFSSGSKETTFNSPSGNFNHINNCSKGSLSKALKHQSLVNLQGPKKQENSAVLPWIKPNKNETNNGGLDLNASANQFMDGSDIGDFSDIVSPQNRLKPVSCSNDPSFRQVVMADSHSRKILGFPISQTHSVCEGHPSFIPSSLYITDQPKEVNTLVKRDLDINLPFEASVSKAVVVDKEEGKKTATYRHYIDLNLCASEDEDSGFCSNPRVEAKATTLIDLEAPPTIESEEERKLPEKRDEETLGSEKNEAGDSVDELIKAAAEAIVTISLSNHSRNTDEAASSSTDPVAKDPLSWFVNTIASCGNDLEKKTDACLEARDCESCREECSSGEFDYFEAMTLNLPHIKEEDYMPKTLVPEYLQLDVAGSIGLIANRPRRGQARRGRPRRDFQRDILPGLASLSKLEVTEDLQMFGGLMKATGYNWNSEVAQRSSNRGGSSRGRKRLVSNINKAQVCSSLAHAMNNHSVQMVGLEYRSFTGWGNATRRPRRQRCPAGNPPTVILT